MQASSLFVAVLLAVASAHAQELPDVAQEQGYAGPYGEQHVRQKLQEGLAIAARMRQNLRKASARDEARYADNRRRCQAALRVAELCGKHAGTFYCDARGFHSLAAAAAAKPALDSRARHKMERCALDVAEQPALSRE